MTASYRFTPGTTPVLLSLPHIGTELPPGFADRLTPEAQALPDTDWHLDHLYDFAGELGCAVLAARFSRFVVDLNRPPDDAPLYQGPATGLFPDRLFDGAPIFRDGMAPGAAAQASALETVWRPYHDRLAQALGEMRARFGVAVLFDAHSIRSVIPRLFEGELPVLNLGTADGRSLAPDLQARLTAWSAGSGVSHVVNGRFKGGYITRQYGRPDTGLHAVQLELAQRCYMDETPPFAYRQDLADHVRPTLRHLVETLIAWGEDQAV